MSVCHFHDDLQNLPNGEVLKPSTWRMLFFPEQRCDDVNVIGRLFFCKVCIMYQVIQVVTFSSPNVGGHKKPFKKGSRKLTIPKRALTLNHQVIIVFIGRPFLIPCRFLLIPWMFQAEGHYYALGEHYNSVVPAWAGELLRNGRKKNNAEVKWCALGGGERGLKECCKNECKLR